MLCFDLFYLSDVRTFEEGNDLFEKKRRGLHKNENVSEMFKIGIQTLKQTHGEKKSEYFK